MSTCSLIYTDKTIETKIWENEGQAWPDTSKPADSQSSTPKEFVDFWTSCPEEDPCPDGWMLVSLSPRA